MNTVTQCPYLLQSNIQVTTHTAVAARVIFLMGHTIPFLVMQHTIRHSFSIDIISFIAPVLLRFASQFCLLPVMPLLAATRMLTRAHDILMFSSRPVLLVNLKRRGSLFHRLPTLSRQNKYILAFIDHCLRRPSAHSRRFCPMPPSHRLKIFLRYFIVLEDITYSDARHA